MFAIAVALLMSHSAPYQEPLRPQFHFTAAAGWLNDPNGLVYYRGEYHLFFQHNPFGTQWGNMTWGHAVSKDLVHWNQIDEAIKPDDLGTIFSGSAVVDSHHSLGLPSKGAAPLVCVYTAAGGTNDASKGKPFTQCIAYSTDGRHFEKFAGNPVLPHQDGENRDPKVIWHEPTHHWVMALYLDGDRYGIFRSTDLKSWQKTCELEMPDTSECPDLFPLKSEGKERWVFWGANGNYRIGSFDGLAFTSETDVLHSHYGNTGYASQTYYDDPKGRRVQISWLNNSEFKDAAWNQQLGFPTVLTLKPTVDGDRLFFWPVEEIKSLWREKLISSGDLSGGGASVASPDGLIDASMAFDVPASGSLTISVNGVEIRYDADTHTLESLGQKAEVKPANGRLSLRLLADRASLELFAQGGLVHMQLFAFADPSKLGIHLSAAQDGWKLDHLEAHQLASAWEK
jgi:sucrose-6-phosphate hydrolase SacC (GH32 family)